MLKKSITYTDYNGVSRTEDFYFNLNKTEILEMQFANKKGFSNVLQDLLDKLQRDPNVATEYLGEALDVVRYLVLTAYGEKSDDGRYFNKSDEISENFYRSPAYEALIMELLTSDKAAADFFNKIAPADVTRKIAESASK